MLHSSYNPNFSFKYHFDLSFMLIQLLRSPGIHSGFTLQMLILIFKERAHVIKVNLMEEKAQTVRSSLNLLYPFRIIS